MEKKHYRPFTNAEVMTQPYLLLFRDVKSKKNKDTMYLISTIVADADNRIFCNLRHRGLTGSRDEKRCSLDELFNDYTFLCDTPIGVVEG